MEVDSIPKRIDRLTRLLGIDPSTLLSNVDPTVAHESESSKRMSELERRCGIYKKPRLLAPTPTPRPAPTPTPVLTTLILKDGVRVVVNLKKLEERVGFFSSFSRFKRLSGKAVDHQSDGIAVDVDGPTMNRLLQLVADNTYDNYRQAVRDAAFFCIDDVKFAMRDWLVEGKPAIGKAFDTGLVARGFFHCFGSWGTSTDYVAVLRNLEEQLHIMWHTYVSENVLLVPMAKVLIDIIQKLRSSLPYGTGAPLHASPWVLPTVQGHWLLWVITLSWWARQSVTS